MDFGKKQLEKYGWREGRGLGKNEDGIADPIKPKLKFDNAGVGHDHGAEFTNNWWETLFNNASRNIDIQVQEETVNFALKSEPIEITTRNYSVKKTDKNALYGSFLKTSKLTNKGTETYDLSVISETSNNFSKLSDEELFMACGGRTAHKGARHGLNLGGKLSRIEKQEKLLLKKMKGVSLDDDTKIAKKMKKLHMQRQQIENEDTNDSLEPVSDSSCSSTKKKKKKSRKSVSFNDTVVEYCIPNSEDNNADGVTTLSTGDVVNCDEGIEQDCGESNNQDDTHKSFEEPQFVVSDLSNAERKKLKKKRKLGKQRATQKLLEEIREELMVDDESIPSCDCKKRKLNIAEAKFSSSKRSQSESMTMEGLIKRQNKKKKMKNKSMVFGENNFDEQKMKNIVQSMDDCCKISDDC